MRFVFIIFSLSVLQVSATTLVRDSIRSERRDNGLFVIHQVEEDETLYSIARRYKGTVQGIIEHNQIIDNTINIGQVIEVLVTEKEAIASTVATVSDASIHQVQEGETLYSISRLYEIKVRQLKKWNELEGNAIAPGMLLKVSEKKGSDPAIPVVNEVEVPNETEVMEVDTVSIDTVSADPFEGFGDYLVQTGETLISIANKVGVSLDSLKDWNNLSSDYLKIGQLLKIKKEDGSDGSAFVENRSDKVSRLDEDGFERIFEEGIASVIESMNTSKYLALHRHLPIGTSIEVRNLMNNQIVHVKVVGKLPNTGLNKNLLLRISKSAYNQLGILDSKARVEVSYFKK